MKKLLTLSFSYLLFIACNKDESGTPTCTTTAATNAGTYKTTAAVYKETSSGDEQDVYDLLLNDCEKDDLMNLKTNSTYEITEGAITCTPPNAPISGSWSISGSNLVLEGESNTIKSFDCKTLVLILNDYDVAGDQLIVTFQKQ
jgi:hypothetical protein